LKYCNLRSYGIVILFAGFVTNILRITSVAYKLISLGIT